MKTLQILMIEDDPWVGFALEDLIREYASVEITILRSVADGESALAKFQFDFAFLDVRVSDGLTYGVAVSLTDRHIPFAFMSGVVSHDELPESLRDAPFLAKPYRAAQVESLLSRIAA